MEKHLPKIIMQMRYACKIAPCLFAFACTSALTPSAGSLYEATQEIGNTYVLNEGRRVYACPEVMKNCFTRLTGSFTLDNSGKEVGSNLAIVHLVFDDGKSGWMAYNAFASQKFADPIQTSRLARLGMSSSQIRASWGAPDEIRPMKVGSFEIQKWTYTGVGNLYFEKDKITELGLDISLLAIK